MNLKLTKEKALELHRKMWSDMRDELGDCPSSVDRVIFKYNWCKKHFPGDNDIENYCFLCEYMGQQNRDCDEGCLVKWDECAERGCISGKISYEYSPISAILALPAREDN